MLKVTGRRAHSMSGGSLSAGSLSASLRDGEDRVPYLYVIAFIFSLHPFASRLDIQAPFSFDRGCSVRSNKADLLPLPALIWIVFSISSPFLVALHLLAWISL